MYTTTLSARGTLNLSTYVYYIYLTYSLTQTFHTDTTISPDSCRKEN